MFVLIGLTIFTKSGLTVSTIDIVNRLAERIFLGNSGNDLVAVDFF